MDQLTSHSLVAGDTIHVKTAPKKASLLNISVQENGNKNIGSSWHEIPFTKLLGIPNTRANFLY